ncbi:AfsR/SARP family transcriptional regulator [Amycolatopsis sp. lyj-23]|uniref:AfsR/SARP family transcriptional regulator n=1 Tax=Amycolatopsis sp. lyj-23 TaxID=2789283 RepID=UPI00397B56D1
MQLGVLGSLLVSADGRSCVPRPPKQQQLLALLITHANTVVSVDQCIEELWEFEAPNTAVQTVQTYIMQLRKILPAHERRRRLVTKDRGYVFLVEPGELDADVFAGLTSEAHRAAAEGHDELAAQRLTAALDLWRGPALAGVQAGPLLRAHLVGLAESRLSAWEQRIEADLRLGRHHELLSELAVLIERYPMHENLYAQFILALYRSGRQARALEVYHRLRKVLADELGLSPSPRMRHLHEAVLAADPLLDPPVRAHGGLSLDLAFSRRTAS